MVQGTPQRHHVPPLPLDLPTSQGSCKSSRQSSGNFRFVTPALGTLSLVHKNIDRDFPWWHWWLAGWSVSEMCGWADQAQAQGQGLCIMDFQEEFRESCDAFQWYNDAPKGCILGSVVWELRACNHFHPLDFSVLCREA